ETLNQIAKSLKSLAKRINQRFFDPSIFHSINQCKRNGITETDSKPEGFSNPPGARSFFKSVEHGRRLFRIN
ncbi:hypothetical protein, partial [Gluconobacter kondonii]|uniref:hypothetical protein n=1 Tax=Gluconobacter kondonii TaxID=941463 RepID=UPI001B8C2A8C